MRSVLALILVSGLGACEGEIVTPSVLGRSCVGRDAIGDLDAATELELVVQAGEGTATLEDGDDVTLIKPAQGGQVLVIGTRARNLVPNGVRVSGWLYDPATGDSFGLEERTAVLAPTGDGWVEPEAPLSIANYVHVAACPATGLPKNVNDQPWDLVVRLEDCRGEAVESRLTVTPRCLEPGNEAQCACECDQGFTQGTICEVEPA